MFCGILADIHPDHRHGTYQPVIKGKIVSCLCLHQNGHGDFLLFHIFHNLCPALTHNGRVGKTVLAGDLSVKRLLVTVHLEKDIWVFADHIQLFASDSAVQIQNQLIVLHGVPIVHRHNIRLVSHGQTSVEVHVLQGEREMAAYNKTLGKFQLGGIAPAPRGVPQIEVTFDIDANGIVKVSAKDLGTGKEANISITASTNLSQEDIDKAVKEAEQFAADDKAKKEEVDTHNAADQTIYQTEKTLGELGDKISADEKASIQAAVDKLKEVNKGNDVAAIKEATEEVQKAFYAVSEKLYQQANPQGQPGAQPGDDNVVDADYETVD